MDEIVFCKRTGKARFSSPGQAERTRNKDRKRKGLLSIYHCRQCNGYHTGRSRDMRLLEMESRLDYG